MVNIDLCTDRDRGSPPDEVPEYIGKKPAEGGHPVVGAEENVQPTDDDGRKTAQGEAVPEGLAVSTIID